MKGYYYLNLKQRFSSDYSKVKKFRYFLFFIIPSLLILYIYLYMLFYIVIFLSTYFYFIDYFFLFMDVVFLDYLFVKNKFLIEVYFLVRRFFYYILVKIWFVDFANHLKKVFFNNLQIYKKAILDNLQICKNSILTLLSKFSSHQIKLNIFIFFRKFYYKIFFGFKRLYNKDANSLYWRYIYYIFYNKGKIKGILNYVFYRFCDIKNFILQFHFSTFINFFLFFFLAIRKFMFLFLNNLYFFFFYFFDKIRHYILLFYYFIRYKFSLRYTILCYKNKIATLYIMLKWVKHNIKNYCLTLIGYILHLLNKPLYIFEKSQKTLFKYFNHLQGYFLNDYVTLSPIFPLYRVFSIEFVSKFLSYFPIKVKKIQYFFYFIKDKRLKTIFKSVFISLINFQSFIEQFFIIYPLKPFLERILQNVPFKPLFERILRYVFK